MGRITFGNDGKPVGVDGAKNSEFRNYRKRNSNLESYSIENYGVRKNKSKIKLKTSSSLDFLKSEGDQNVGDIFSKDYWSLSQNGENLKPLKFANGKTQEDVVREIVELSKNHRVIFLHGTCGSGKSAIALNVARVLGKSSIVVPVKALQTQYEEDYLTKKYLTKTDGGKMKIAMLTGRSNHDSILQPGVSCADPSLPENIKIVDRNKDQILKYVKDNPFVKNPRSVNMENVRRVTIASSNPYWAPIVSAHFELKSLTDATKKKYIGCDGEDYIFYHRKKGCSYYDQYLSYFSADVIIFNSAKYRAELSIGRKPLTEVDIIDEADEFLDNFFQKSELNLTRILFALRNFHSKYNNVKDSLKKMVQLIETEEKNKKVLGIDENKVFRISETKIKSFLEELNSNLDLEAEITLDELNYLNRALEAAQEFKKSLDDVYLTYRKDEDNNIFVKLVSTSIAEKFKDLLSKTKTLIFMSGTLHSEDIIKNIFGIKDFAVVHAEKINFGSTEIVMTGKEFDCKYSNFASKKHSREDYLSALSACMEKATLPVLVHVHAFKDLPDEKEKKEFELDNLMSSEKLREIQMEDKTGKAISNFKSGLASSLVSTKCSRGVDFPGEICNSIVFTKYPNPNISDTFWKVLQQTHSDYYWKFYRDKAWREFLQRIYRALRSPDDHVLILSPDKRVLEGVRKLQVGS
jgi:Rad3-related DNA helicase